MTDGSAMSGDVDDLRPDGESAVGPAALERRLGAELAPDLEVLRFLGSDRSAHVFLGRERALERLVVVKVLGSASAENPVAHRRFEREAQSVAALSDPRVVSVHRFGRLSDGTPYLIMQYVPGRSAEDRLVAEGPVPVNEVLPILADVAAALEAAHARGIVHRDVRPANILLESGSGRAVLTGFGIATLLPESGRSVTTLTAQGETLGIPHYLSPEQLRGEPVTDRADVYALAVTAWTLMTGYGPYGDLTPRAVVSAHLSGEPRSLAEACPELPPSLPSLLQRCLAKTPKHRPPASHVAARLSDPRGEPNTPPAPPSGFFPTIRRRRLVQILGAYVAVAFAILEGVDQLVGQGIFPDVAYRLALVTGLGGLPVAALLGWYHGEKGAQSAKPFEVVLLLGVGTAWLAVVLWILVH